MGYNQPDHWQMTREDMDRADKANQDREVRRQKPFLNAEKDAEREDQSDNSRSFHERETTAVSKLRKDIENLFENLSIMVNRGQERELVDELMYNLNREHRTLQQGFVRVLVGVLNAYGDSTFDGRNADAVRLSRMFKEQFKDKSYLPLV